jgi:hypothetical protein
LLLQAGLGFGMGPEKRELLNKEKKGFLAPEKKRQFHYTPV